MNPILIAVLTLIVIGAVCAVILVLASKFMAVPVDERFPMIRDCLPGANCGGCGFAGCDGYAQALVDGSETRINLCVAGADAVAMKLSEALGVEFQDVVEMCAYVKCNGTCDNAKQKMEYAGINNCHAANILFNGKWGCPNSCLGYGDCEHACPNGAIKVVNGVARVFPDICTGCGICARQCPNHIIELRKAVDSVVVRCANHEKGMITRQNCTTGCLGCMKCQKTCPNGAITVTDNLAVIDYEKCTGCGACAEACPVHCIKKLF